MNRVWCAFESHYTNPLTGRAGRWRVIEAYPVRTPSRLGSVVVALTTAGKRLGVIATTKPKHGSIISPRAEMLRYIREAANPGD